MRNDAPIVLAEWAARVNAETRTCMGVSVFPEECREAQAYLDGLMSDQEAAACVAADLAAVRNLTAATAESADNDDAAVRNLTADADDYAGLSPTFAAACRKADQKQHSKPPDPHTGWPVLAKVERGKSLERAYTEVHRAHFRGRVAESTVEALMFSLREHGIAAVRSRLAQLSEQQLIEVGDRLQRLKPKIARAWSADEVEKLIGAWEEARS